MKKESLNPIVEYQIDLEEDNTNEAYFEEVWMNAVDDGLVDFETKMDYEMKFAEDIPAK